MVKPVNDNSERKALGRYPSIGSILHDFVKIAGLKEKQFKPNASFDREIQRLANETDINLDRYCEFLDMVY